MAVDRQTAAALDYRIAVQNRALACPVCGVPAVFRIVETLAHK
jgi:hypothetical protein